jgi:hypothetical protein
MTDRRDFMQRMGVALAALLATRCRPPAVSCYEPMPITPNPFEGLGEGWEPLRQAWLDLDLLARDAADWEQGEATRDRLIAQHDEALKSLTASGELSADVAEDLQAAFEGAAYHVWQSNSLMTCYDLAAPTYGIDSSQDLTEQAELLLEMAGRSAIDEATVAQAQAAIERDVAYIALPYQDQRAIIEAVQEEAGSGYDYPPFHEVDLDIPPESREAAAILVELLLER